MSGSVVIDGNDGDCGGRSGVVIVSELIVRLTEGETRASVSLRKPPPSSAAAPKSGAGVCPGEALGETVTVVGR